MRIKAIPRAVLALVFLAFLSGSLGSGAWAEGGPRFDNSMSFQAGSLFYPEAGRTEAYFTAGFNTGLGPFFIGT